MRRIVLLAGVVAVVVGIALLAVSIAGGDSIARPQLLVYVSERPNNRLSGDEVGNLFTLRADGSGLHQLTKRARSESDPEWSPNGQHIAYSEGVGVPRCNGGFCDIVNSSVIWVIDAAGRHARRITQALLEATTSGESAPFLDSSPTWSPDGRRIAFAHVLNDVSTGEASPNDGVYVVGADGQGLRRVLAGARWVRSLDWSPDGKRLAFVNRDGRVGLLDLGTAKVMYTTRGHDVAWSPNGRSLAVTRDSGVYVVPAQGGAARRIVPCLPDPTRGYYLSDCYSATWSEDGRQLAFSAAESDRANSRVGLQADLFIVNIDGRGLKRITGNPSPDFKPDWRP
jgi:Tol biopolymer transport system component